MASCQDGYKKVKISQNTQISQAFRHQELYTTRTEYPKLTITHQQIFNCIQDVQELERINFIQNCPIIYSLECQPYGNNVLTLLDQHKLLEYSQVSILTEHGFQKMADQSFVSNSNKIFPFQKQILQGRYKGLAFICFIQYHSDGMTLLCKYIDSIIIHNTSSAAIQHTLQTVANSISQYSPTGDTLMFGLIKLQFINLSSGKEFGSQLYLDQRLLDFKWSPNSQYLLTKLVQKLILWEFATRRLLAEIQIKFGSACFSLDSKSIFCTEGHQIYILNIESLIHIKTIQNNTELHQFVRTIRKAKVII